jgi:predicted flap endonuclease-1-like 5' DNA nuclease
MTDISEREACTKRCWWLGAGAGLLVAFLLLAFGIWGLLMSIVAGVLVALIVGYLALTLLCKDVPAAAPQDSTRSAAAASVAGASTASGNVSSAVGSVPAGDAGIGAARKASAPVEPAEETPPQEPTAPVADTAAVEAAPEQVAKAEEAVAVVTPPKEAVETPSAPSKETPLQEPTAPVADTAAVEAAPEQVIEAEEAPAVVKTPQEVVEAPAEPAKAEPAPVPATDSHSTDGKPALLDAPRAGGADDLKRIGGIGPKLEQTLNELGIFHFDQIAALQGDEIDWVDSRLRFKGRIRRDDWIGQAKAFANDGKAKG